MIDLDNAIGNLNGKLNSVQGDVSTLQTSVTTLNNIPIAKGTGLGSLVQNGCEASENVSAAFGEGTKAYVRGQVVVGKYNKGADGVNEPLFVVGCGDSDTSRSDIFEVFDNEARLWRSSVPDEAETYAVLKQSDIPKLNGQYIIGQSNLNFLRVQSSNEININFDNSGDLLIGYATLDSAGAKRSSVTINSYKFCNGNNSGTQANIYCAKLYTSSDERVKENIVPYKYHDSILDIEVKEFDYKGTGTHAIGVIAQDVQKTYPELVKTDEKTGYLSVDEHGIMYALLEEVKQLKKRVEELERR